MKNGFIYTGENLREISFPLGGIGTGSVGIAGNGKLIDFENRNNSNKGSYDGHTGFYVKTVDGEKNVCARALIGDTYKELVGRLAGGTGFSGYGFGPGNSGIGMPHFENVEFEGKFPVANLKFTDKGFPGEITLTAFNPFIPLDSYNSSIPAAFFEITFNNTTDNDLEFTTVFVKSNPLNDGQCSFIKNNGSSGIHQFQTVLDKNNPKYGDETVLTDAVDNVYYQESWYRGCWMDGSTSFWNDFTSLEPLKNRHYDERKDRDCSNLSVIIKVPAGESKKIRFVYAWNHPNRINDWNKLPEGVTEHKTWKNYYATVFEDSAHSAKYAIDNFDELLQKTESFKNALYDSTLPMVVTEAAAANLSVLKSPTVLRLEDGSFYGWEGVKQTVGSCEGSCDHVWNYAYALCFLFPELERSMRELEFKYSLCENGKLMFRLSLPLNEKRTVWTPPCVDGQMGTLIKCYRDFKISGDKKWLEDNWESIKKVADYPFVEEAHTSWDINMDGVLEGRQHHTLDMELFGPSGWLQGMYFAGLTAAAEIARILGKDEDAEKWMGVVKKGRKWCEENLFNGEYFIHKVDLTDKSILEKFNAEHYWNEETGEIKYQIGEGCEIDQMLGQWHAHLCGLGYIFDEEKVKKSLKSIYKYNFKPVMRDYCNLWRVFCLDSEGGTVMCDYPKGSTAPKIPVPYATECMTGFEYQVAEHMIYEGMVDEGLELITAIRDRYDGAKRNPWNEIECGSNYARSMASFALIPVFSRFEYDMSRGALGFNPIRKSGEQFKSFFSVAEGYGNISANDNEFKITLVAGSLTLKELHLPSFEGKTVTLYVDGKETACENKSGRIVFDKVKAEKELFVKAE